MIETHFNRRLNLHICFCSFFTACAESCQFHVALVICTVVWRFWHGKLQNVCLVVFIKEPILLISNTSTYKCFSNVQESSVQMYSSTLPEDIYIYRKTNVKILWMKKRNKFRENIQFLSVLSWHGLLNKNRKGGTHSEFRKIPTSRLIPANREFNEYNHMHGICGSQTLFGSNK